MRNNQNQEKSFKSYLILSLRIGAVLLAIFTLYTTIYIIPYETYEANPILISFASGILVTLMLYLGLSPYLPDGFDALGAGVLVVAIPVALVVYHANQKNRTLKRDGISGVGTVIDKTTVRAGESTTYKVKIMYLDEEMNDHIAIADATYWEYEKINLFDMVPVIYSPSNPQFIGLLKTKDKRDRYNVDFSDLEIEVEKDVREMTREELQAKVTRLENQIKETDDKLKQMDLLGELVQANHYLKQLDSPQ